MVIPHKPASFLNEQSKMRNTFNRIQGVGFGEILRHVQEDRILGLEDIPAIIPLHEAAIGDPHRVATAELKMWEIMQKNSKFSQYNAALQLMAANLDCNPSSLRNALRMELFKDMADSFT